MYEEILSNIIIKKITAATSMYKLKDHSGKRYNRERWSVNIKYNGESRYYCNGKEYVSNNKNIIILPKGVSYEWKSITSGEFYIVEFDADYEYHDIIPIKVSDCQKIVDIIKTMEHKRLTKSHMYIPECIKNTYEILINLFANFERKYVPSTKVKKIQPALDYIENNYNKNIKNDFLAQMCGVSTVYFRKIFTEYFSMSPVTYIHTLRIRKAKEMLKSDFSSVSDISASLGYINIYDFSRDFKKYTGISPTQYAETHK